MAVKLPSKLEPKLEPIELEEVPPPEFTNFEESPPGFKILVHETAPFPAKTIRADKEKLFFQWIAELTEDDWNHIIVYLYREWPVIDRKQVNPNATNNIDKLITKFDKESIKKEHGSGKYHFMVNDVNRAKGGKGGTLGIAYLDIEDSEYPPKFVLEELVTEHPSNRRIRDKLIAEGKLTIEGRPMTAQGGTDNTALIGLVTQLISKLTQQPQQTKDGTMDNVASMFKTTHEATIGMLKDQMKSDDPDKWIKIMALMRDMMPKSESGNEMLALVMKMQGDMAKVQAESQTARETLMLKMMEMMNQKNDTSDAFDRDLDRMTKLKELIGENGGGKGKQSTLETVLEFGAPVAMKLMDTIMGFVNVKNAVDGLRKQQAAQGQQQPAPDMPPPSLEPPQTNPKGENVVEMPQQQQIPMTALIRGPVGQMIIDALKSGTPGDDFAQSVETLHTRLIYDQIASMGKDHLLNSMKAVPEFWTQVTPKAIEKFVDEFLAYGVEEPMEEE